MANLTRKAILATFDEMVSEMSFDKITVSALVKRAEISSNTFYYHYRDIYDLLDDYLLEHLDKVLGADTDWNNWTKPVKDMLYYMKDHQRQVYHILNSLSRQRLEEFAFIRIQPRFQTIARTVTAGHPLNDDQLRIIAKIYCYTFLGFLLEFIRDHMEDGIEASVNLLSDSFNDMAQSYIQRHASQNR